MVNEQEGTATPSNITKSDTPTIPSSSFSCSMGLESNSTALGNLPLTEKNILSPELNNGGIHDLKRNLRSHQDNTVLEMDTNTSSYQSSEVTINEMDSQHDSMANLKDIQAVHKKRGRGRPRKQEKDMNFLKEEESSRSSFNSINSLEKEALSEDVENGSVIENNSSPNISQRNEAYSNAMTHVSYPDVDGHIDNVAKNDDVCQTTLLSANTENLTISGKSDVNEAEIPGAKARSSNRIRGRAKVNKNENNQVRKVNSSNKIPTRNGKMLNTNSSDQLNHKEPIQNGHNNELLSSPKTPKILNRLSMNVSDTIPSSSEHIVKAEEDSSSSQDSKETSDTLREGSVKSDSELNLTLPLKVKSRWHNASQNDITKDSNTISTNKTESETSNTLALCSPNRNEFHAASQTFDSKEPMKQKRETRNRIARRMSSKQTTSTHKNVEPLIDNEECNDTSSEAVKDYSNKEIVTPAQQLEIEQRLKSFEHISTNTFVCQRRRNKQTRDMECDCSITKEDFTSGRKGCGDDCLNRLLMVECNKSCSLGDNCGNKRFQNIENAPTEVFKTEYKGVGLRAAAQIARDSFIMEYVGEVLDPQRFHKRAKKYSQNDVKHFYFMALSTDYIIDATSKGNISRFINHSCDPNAETQKWTVDGELRVGFFSKRKIKLGEEITFDYKYERYGQQAQKCYCGANNCRGWLGGEPEKDDPDSSDEETPERDEESSLSSDGPDETESVMHYDKIECDTSSPIEDPGFSPSWSQKISPPKVRRYRRRLRRTPRKIKNFETDEFEEDIERLRMTGIRTKGHTVDLCRLMVRVTETKTKLTLCHLLLDADSPCRRLFLDYHGLKILNSWMADLKWDSLIDLDVKIALEDVLGILNIPHKTMLVESNIWQAVSGWASADVSKKVFTNQTNLDDCFNPNASGTLLTSGSLVPSKESQSRVTEMEIDSTTSKINENDNLVPSEDSSSITDETLILQKLKSINQKLSENTINECDQYKEVTSLNSLDVTNNASSNLKTLQCTLNEDCAIVKDNTAKPENSLTSEEQEIQSKALIVKEKAQSLLDIWVGLKEVFKIPRKELVKLRVEHEKELDEAEQHLKKNQTHHGEDPKHSGFNNFNQQRFLSGNTANNRFGYERNRQIFRPHSPPPLPKHRETRCSKFDDKTGRLNSTGLSRDHRRYYISQKFEMEKEEKRKRDLLQAWHENKCYYLRLDPSITPMFPEIPEFYFDPTVGTWYQMPELPPQVDVWGKLGFPHMARLPKEAYRETDSPLPDPTLIYPPGVVKVSYLYGQPMSLDPSYNNAQIDIPEPEPEILPQNSSVRRENSSLSPLSRHNLPMSYIDPETGQEVPIPEEQNRSNMNFHQQNVQQTIPTLVNSGNDYNRDLISPAFSGVSEQCNVSQPHDPIESNNIVLSTVPSYQRDRSNSISPSSLTSKQNSTNSYGKSNYDSQHKSNLGNRKTGTVMVKLPSSWRVTRDSRGRVYYYNMRTKETQWVPPQGTETLEEATIQNQSDEGQSSHQIDVLGTTPESDDDIDDGSKVDSPMDEDGDESDIDEDDDADLNLDMDLDAKSIDNPQGPYSDLSDQERNILLRFSKLSKEERQNERRQKRERDREKKEYERKRRRERHGKHRKDGLVTEHLIPKRGEREKTDLMTFQEMRERLANRDAIREKQEIEEREEAERDREEERKRQRQIEKDKREQQEAERQAAIEKKAAQQQAVILGDKNSPSNSKDSFPDSNTSTNQVPQQSEENFTSSCEQTSKTTTAAADTSSEVSKKIKENFMKEASKIIVKVLDPFRKGDAQKAKIQTTEDFKHLAKKLTEYILVKEMKHCPRIEDLRFTESTKKKAAEFVRKYMLKFGDTYKRSPQKY